jgi:hypothetical protein
VVSRVRLAITRAALLANLGAGCADAPPEALPTLEPDAARDAMDDTRVTLACDLSLRLGLGGAPFAPLSSEVPILPLERGPQGLQHVVLSAQAAIPPGFSRLQLALTAPDEANPRAAMTLTLPWTAVAGANGDAEVTGVLFVIEAPDAVLETPLRLTAQVDGARAACADHAVVVRWQ